MADKVVYTKILGCIENRRTWRCTTSDHRFLESEIVHMKHDRSVHMGLTPIFLTQAIGPVEGVFENLMAIFLQKDKVTIAVDSNGWQMDPINRYPRLPKIFNCTIIIGCVVAGLAGDHANGHARDVGQLAWWRLLEHTCRQVRACRWQSDCPQLGRITYWWVIGQRQNCNAVRAVKHL